MKKRGEHRQNALSVHRSVASNATNKNHSPDRSLTPAQTAIAGAVMLLCLLSYVAVGKQAQRKGQSFWLGFLFSMLVSAALTSIFIAFLRPADQRVDLERYQYNTTWWRILLVLAYCLPLLYVGGIIFLIAFLFFGVGASEFLHALLSKSGL